MKMRFSVYVLCFSLLSTAALAQLDPGPDGIGVYADMEGMVNSVMQNEGLLTVQLLVMGCQNGTGIQAWETGFWVDGSLSYAGFQLPYEGFNLDSFPDMTVGVHIGVDNLPIPRAPIMHLATLYFMVGGPEPGNIYIKPVSHFGGSGSMGNFLPAYATQANELFALYPSSGSVDLPVFRVNGDAPVATTQAAFGAVKALFR